MTGVHRLWLIPLSKSPFQDDAWSTPYQPGHGYVFHPAAAAELVHYFLRFPPVMNETFSHFVSGRLLSPITSLRGYDFSLNAALPMILDALIIGLESDVLNPGTIQQSIDYVFIPENLFTACALLFMRLSTRSALRHLALLRRDDPAWPECLMQLDTFPAHFEVQFHPSTGPHAISEFRASVEGACGGVYGLDTSDSQTPGRDQDGSCRPAESPSRISFWLNQFWPRRARCSGDGQV
ncbi:hypothetical protein IW262DRAFT_459161 [Armillaria fumosa]|nr:hypothetical protein IW262DRAFT_459161 [Armillaria fumosa]